MRPSRAGTLPARPSTLPRPLRTSRPEGFFELWCRRRHHRGCDEQARHRRPVAGQGGRSAHYGHRCRLAYGNAALRRRHAGTSGAAPAAVAMPRGDQDAEPRCQQRPHDSRWGAAIFLRPCKTGCGISRCATPQPINAADPLSPLKDAGLPRHDARGPSATSTEPERRTRMQEGQQDDPSPAHRAMSIRRGPTRLALVSRHGEATESR